MENKTGKYLKYAIGEIVLVVIGILIALSINNWNENRKNNSKKEVINTKKFSTVNYNNWRDKIRISYQAPKIWDVENPQDIGEYGMLIHEILAAIVQVKDVEKVLNKFLLNGIINEEELQIIAIKINKLLNIEKVNYFFTNFDEIKKRRDYMEELMQKRDSGELEKYTKKERLQISRKIVRLRQFFSGLEQLKTLPSALMVVDTRKENIAVVEAKKKKIPVIGIMNSDCDPDDAVYPIPANDNSIASVELFLNEIVESYREGLNEREKETKKEEEKSEEGEKSETGDTKTEETV